MFVSCVHPLAVLNAAFCMTCMVKQFAISLGVVFINYVGSVYIGGLTESRPCVFRELFPVVFLVIGESPSVLL